MPVESRATTGPVVVAKHHHRFGVGGAEIALHRLLTHLDPELVTPIVISLTRRGVVADRLEEVGHQGGHDRFRSRGLP